MRASRESRRAEALKAVEHLLRPPRPDHIAYSTDPIRLADDPSGETHSSFFQRLQPWLTSGELKTVERAYVFSKYGHRDQKRSNGERYFNHTRATTLVLIDELQVRDIETICGSLLHDICEDSRLLDSDIINMVFGREVMTTVNLLTKDPATKASYFKTLIASHRWRPLIIKCCDRLHNIRTLHHMKPEKVPIQIAETRAEFPAVLEALASVLPKELDRSAIYLGKAIFELCDAQERISREFA